MKCRICHQEIRQERTADAHHLEPSPIESALCMGCYVGSIGFELWVLRATGRSFFSLKLHGMMEQIAHDLSEGRNW